MCWGVHGGSVRRYWYTTLPHCCAVLHLLSPLAAAMAACTRFVCSSPGQQALQAHSNTEPTLGELVHCMVGPPTRTTTRTTIDRESTVGLQAEAPASFLPAAGTPQRCNPSPCLQSGFQQCRDSGWNALRTALKTNKLCFQSKNLDQTEYHWLASSIHPETVCELHMHLTLTRLR